jgi:hypothetical protein
MRLPRVRVTVLRTMVAVAVLAAVIVALERRHRLHTAAQARFEAALLVYDEAERLFLSGETDHLPVYAQSRMLLEAQRDLGDASAARDHLTRMRNLQKKAAPLCNNHLQHQVALFVLEAEYWAMQERW